MPDILHRVGIDAKPAKVYEALTTLKGNQEWWSKDAKGDAKKGGVLNFFGGWAVFKVMETKTNKLVKWKCVDGAAEWIGTTVSFELVYKKKQTFVLFKHAKWKKPVEFMYHCSTKWGVFMLSLKDYAETGQGHPKPNDILITISGD